MLGLKRDVALQLWDAGDSLPPVDRALLLLGAALDGTSDDLAELPLGRRDAELLHLRELTFGPQLDLVVVCPHCGQSLESTLTCAGLLAAAPVDTGRTHRVQLVDGWVEFRLPTSVDVAAIRPGSPEQVVAALVARCVLRPADRPLDEQTIAAIAQRMLELDPQAEVMLDLSCDRCQRSASHLFDIAEFFWAEIRSYALRLLQDVDALARAYGWREGDVLALTDKRRARYLQLIA